MSAATEVALRAPRKSQARALTPGKLARKTGFFLLLAIFVIVSLFPFYWIVDTSLKTPQEIDAGTTSLLPGHVTFSNYIDDFTQQDFIRPLLNSVLVAGCTTIVTVLLAALAGYALARTEIRLKPVWLGFILLANFFPVIAIVGPLFRIYVHIGLLDSYPGLIIADLIYTLPLATFLMSSYFSQIPKSLEEAALVDGSTRLRTLRKIIIPVALPGVFTTAILAFMFTWNDFILTLSFMTSPSRYLATQAIVSLGQSPYAIYYNLIDAAVVIISVPIAVLVLFAQRRIVSGLTAGSFR
ncbi:MAG TPA: carbohydrate ABC transporter permease [Streptosporangiaceae bacterium]|nr:carbohydrate ABC transporter permease [Streptosporangiaceae bacterium]